MGIDEQELEPENFYTEKERGQLVSLMPILEALFPDYDIVESRIKQQYDKVSCEPITINNLVEYAKNGAIPDHVDVAQIRAEHRAILEPIVAERERKVESGICTVAEQLIISINGRFDVSGDQEEEIRHMVTELLTQNYVDTGNGGFKYLTDKRNPSILSDQGQKLASYLLTALMNTGIIAETALEDGITAKPAICIEQVKLNDGSVREQINQAIMDGLMQELSWSMWRR